MTKWNTAFLHSLQNVTTRLHSIFSSFLKVNRFTWHKKEMIDLGLAGRGVRPKPSRRTMTKEEWKADRQMLRIRANLAATAPIQIPWQATVKREKKKGYTQIKFEWTDKRYHYQARWHTRTSRAPSWQGNTWVVERRDVKNNNAFILTNRNVWTPKRDWQRAIRARRRGKANDEQHFLLNCGHWTAQSSW